MLSRLGSPFSNSLTSSLDVREAMGVSVGAVCSADILEGELEAEDAKVKMLGQLEDASQGAKVYKRWVENWRWSDASTSRIAGRAV